MVRDLRGQCDPRRTEISLEVAAHEVNRSRADALVDQIGLADVDVDPIGVGVGADVDRRVLLEVREPPVELQVPRGAAVDLDDAGGGLVVAAHRWAHIPRRPPRTSARGRPDPTIRGHAVPRATGRATGNPPDRRCIARIVRFPSATITIGSKRVRRAGYGRGMDTDTRRRRDGRGVGGVACRGHDRGAGRPRDRPVEETGRGGRRAPCEVSWRCSPQSSVGSQMRRRNAN